MPLRATRSIAETLDALRAKAPIPLPHGAYGDPQLLGDHPAGLALNQPRHEFPSTKWRESGILVDVHPGLLFRDIDCLAAINFPQVGLGEQPIASSQLVVPSCFGTIEGLGHPSFPQCSV